MGYMGILLKCAPKPYFIYLRGTIGSRAEDIRLARLRSIRDNRKANGNYYSMLGFYRGQWVI